MTRRDRPSAALDRVLLVLAVLALIFRVAAPPGTMVANMGHCAALVICTGHGPMSAMAAQGKAPASKTHSDGSCEFAAHAAYALSPDVLPLAGSSSWTATALPQPVMQAQVGSGLAAPPPPSQAPPILSV